MVTNTIAHYLLLIITGLICQGSSSWSAPSMGGSIPSARAAHSAVLTSNNTMLVFGGQTDKDTASFVQQIYAWTPSNNNTRTQKIS